MVMETSSAMPPGIDIRGVPAVIEWTAGEQHRCLGTSLSSTPAFFDIDFNASTSTASFRPRVALFRRHSDRPIPVYLVIKPKELQSISLCALSQESRAVEGPRNSTIHLLFRLHSPATLVVPPDPMRLNNNAQAAIFRLVRSAAQQTTLSIHLQAGVLSQAQLKTLCDADYQSFGPSRCLADLSTLYGGRGGKVIEPTAVEAPAESPPSYNELEAPPPVPPVSYGKPSHLSTFQLLARANLLGKAWTQLHPPRSVGGAAPHPKTWFSICLWLKIFVER